MAVTSSITIGELSIYQVDADPTTAGISAAQGSVSLLYTGASQGFWLKNGAGNTAWSAVLDAQSAQTVSGVKTFSAAPVFSQSPRISTLTSVGRVLLAGTSGTISDSPSLNWDNTNSRLGIGGTAATYPLEVTGKMYSSAGYIMRSDLSMIPIIGNQSAITTWWGMQLVGNRQSNVDYTPTAIGANNIASVIIPNQQAGSIGLLIRGQTSQVASILDVQNVSGTSLFGVLASGLVNAPNAIRLGTTADTTNGNVRYNGLDVEMYRNTWRSITFPKYTFDDFLWTAVGTSMPFAWTSNLVNGGDITFNLTSGATYSGIVTMSTGIVSNAIGVAALQSGSGTLIASGLPITVEWRVRIPVVSTTPFFEFRVGIQDTATAGDPTNGAYFSYIDSGAASTWQCVTRRASTSTTNSSGVTIYANIWYRLRIEINAANTSTAFYIDSGSGYVLVANNVTNNTFSPLRMVAKINKITLSNIARTAELDYALLSVER